MKKQMISVRLDVDAIEKLKKISEKENRSQGQEIQHLIVKEFDRLGLKEELTIK